jgi:acyl carrier protein
VLHPGSSASETDIRRFLLDRLAQYAVPSTLNVVDALPRTTNGKVDYASLSAMSRRKDDNLVARSAHDLSDRVRRIWQDVLEIPAVGAEDNFFDLGGHSLLAAVAARAIDERCGARCTVLDLYLYPTVRALATFLSAGRSEMRATPVADVRVARTAVIRRAKISRNGMDHT